MAHYNKEAPVLFSMAAWAALGLYFLISPLSAASSENREPESEAGAFRAATRLYQRSSEDKSGAIQSLQAFSERHSKDPKVADAYFLIGEAHLGKAIETLRKDPAFLRNGLDARLASGVLKGLELAEENFQISLKKASDDGLKCSATYRLGEAAYNRRDWKLALERFKSVTASWPNSYLAPESLSGMANCHLALGNYPQADQVLTQLVQSFPSYAKEPAIAYAQGVIAYSKGEYEEAQKLLSTVQTPEAAFYLAKDYLALKKPLLAATLFDKLVKELPTADLRESSAFFLGDAFFVSEDYDGAASKYEELLRSYPFSRFKVASLYRIASSRFQKKEYPQARLSWGTILSQFPSDYYAPIAQYWIGESYRVSNQMREALFSYSKALSQYKGSIVEPLVLYRLLWAQKEVGEDAQAVQTADQFLVSCSTHVLARNVYLIKGQSLGKLKKVPESMAAYQKIVDLNPMTEIAEQALFLMLKTQYDQKDFNSVLTSYQYLFKGLAASKSKWRSFACLVVAESYLALNQPAEALTVYETALKMYPDPPASVYAQDGMAWCYQSLGRHEEARRAREKLQAAMTQDLSSMEFASLNDLGIADNLYSQKAYSAAYQYYDKFIKENPASKGLSAALYRAGLALYKLRFYSQAIEEWRKLVAQFPSAPEAELGAYQLASTLFRGGRYKEAETYYSWIVEKFPQSQNLALAYLRLAQGSFQMKDGALVLKRVQDLLFKFPAAPEAMDAFELAEAVFDANPRADFREFFKSVITADPRSATAAEAQFRLARRLYEAKDYAAAAQEFQRFSVGYTNHASLSKAQLLLGESLFNQSKFAEAAPAYERYLNNYSGEADASLALLRLGSAYFNIKEYAKAAGAYEKLASGYPDSEYAKAAQFNLALSHKSAGNLDSAQIAYEKYAGRYAKGDEVMGSLWELLNIQKEKRDYGEALKTLAKMKSLAPPSSEAALEVSYRLGELQSLMGDDKGAALAWKEMVSMRPAGSPFRLQALIKLGELYERNSEFKNAISAYEDLARSATSQDMARAASEKALGLKKTQSEVADKPAKRELTR